MSVPALSSSRIVAALAVLVRFAARVQKAQERRKIVYSLASLDDHMLRDIGLNRCDVDSVMAEPVLTDGTLLLAERVMDGRRHQRALAQEAQNWASLTPDAGVRALQPAVKRAA